MFLIQRNCGLILNKGKNRDSPLAESDRRALIIHSHAYLQLKCSSIENPYVVQVAKTLVFLVPSLHDTTAGDHAGFVRFN